MGTVPTATPPSRRAAAPAPPSSMETAARSLHFYLTGFGPFHEVSNNPTEALMNSLPAYIRSAPLPSRLVLASAQTLEVSAEAARAEMRTLYARLADASACSPGPARVVVHFGVNLSITRFALETRARNEATFLCPDERGWAPIMQRIDPAEPVLSAVRASPLPVPALVAGLRKEGFPVDASGDAGKFVCNFVYYTSLARAGKTGAQALFVHVPPHAVVPLEEQLRFTRALLVAIATLPPSV